MNTFDKLLFTVKLGFKELLNKEQLGNSEPFSLTNMPVHSINSEQIGFSDQSRFPISYQKVGNFGPNFHVIT